MPSWLHWVAFAGLPTGAAAEVTGAGMGLATWGTVDSAKEFMGRHGIEFENPLKIVSRGKDWMEAWNQVWHW